MMKNESLTDKVYKSLRFDILTRKIPGGKRITESAVAKELNVSRTPVREALLKLTQEKLITAIPRTGYIVEDMSDNDIQDLFSIRMEIELIAVRKAVRYITVDELKLLDDNLELTKAGIKSGEIQKITDLDIAFHSAIYRASRSRTLFMVCKQLSDLTMKYRHGLNLVRNLWNEAVRHHINIYQALLVRDEEKAVKAVTLHSEQAKSHLLDIMKKVRSDSFSIDEL